MKRLLFVAVLALSFSVAAIAPASTTSFVGSFEEGGLMNFHLKKRNGHQTIRGFEWGDGVPTTCSLLGSGTITGNMHSRIRVKDNKFRKTENIGIGTQRVTGRFTSKHKAKGTLRVQAALGPPAGDCDTGKLHWTAATDEG